MNNFSLTPEFPKFPFEEFKVEQEQDHAEFKSTIQELSQVLLAQLKEQNPELMNAKITKQNDIEISLILSENPLDGILFEYHSQVKNIVLKDINSRLEKELGRPITHAELTFSPFFTSLSEIKKLDHIEKDYVSAVGKGLQNHWLTWIKENIPDGQTTRPNIQIHVYVPGRRGSRMFIYVESNGIVLINDVFKPPTVTLDTNVIIEWWDNQDKVEYVEKLLELGKKFEIDMAVTRRIHDDLIKRSSTDEINDLPNQLIHEIGAVARLNNWKVGIDTVGISEFMDFIGSIEISDAFNHMNKDKRPDWRDWDHIHTHYRYGRNYFLTWDSRISYFKNEFENFGIRVMKPEEYLSQHQSLNLDEWVKQTIYNSSQN